MLILMLAVAETVSLALDLKEEGIMIVSICPGWVKTDMGNSPVSVIGGTGPELEPPASIGGMLSLMDGLTIEQTGSFFNYEGKIVPF
jgi:NAD(P)-dependent dehydrogenase (short-subunit alcohol dehydrogenase family)